MHTYIALGREIVTPLYRAMRFFIENSRENKSGGWVDVRVRMMENERFFFYFYNCREGIIQ